MQNAGVKTEPNELETKVETKEELGVNERLSFLEAENRRLRNQNRGELEKSIGGLVAKILSPDFEWRVLGYGEHQALEIEVPERFASLVSSKESNKFIDYPRDPKTKQILKNEPEVEQDGRRTFPVGHPKAGQRMGDVRTKVIRNEKQIAEWLVAMKKNILAEKEAEKPLEANYGPALS